ncbi:MAG TPA: baseplate J/gp47 family protein [Dehalococcoidia bacterium]|nr:baseplate J/gp47 family protein [Dehalococcoidia bacterium]
MLSPRPAIDYTDKDFRSLRDAMLRLAQDRLPEWTDRSPADLGMLFVDLFAYMGDITLYYQDRIASELFPSTAVERRSIVDLLRLIGYDLSASSPARADLLLTFTAPVGPQTVTVPNGARFSARPANASPVEFVYLGPDLAITLSSDQVRPALDAAGNAVVLYEGLPVEQSVEAGPLIIGSSTGEPNQVFALPGAGVVRESVLVEVDEGSGWVVWDRSDSLLFDIAPDGRAILSHPDARHYQLIVDAADVTNVLFAADRQPPIGTNNIRASFRRTQGAAGNVAAGTINTLVTPVPALVAVINPGDAAGGSDAERSDHAIRYAPLVYRSNNRAVTISDYVALAQSTGAVAKVRAQSQAWNQIDLYVAPAGPVCTPVPEALRNWLLGYMEDKRMAGTFVRVLDAHCVPIDISLELIIEERFAADSVISRVYDAVAQLLAFDRVDFAEKLFQSDVYAAAEGVAGVIAVTVKRFRRRDQPATDLEAELARYNLPSLAELPDFLRNAISSEIAPEGRIEAGEFEIPSLGDLSITTRTSSS